MRHLDPCPCSGTMLRYATKTKGRVRTRYLKCDRCQEHGVERFYLDERGRPVFVAAGGGALLFPKQPSSKRHDLIDWIRTSTNKQVE